MKIATEQRPDGSSRFRVQHKDTVRPGKYTTRRFDDKNDAAEFVRRAKIGLLDAIAWDDERKGGVSFRGQAGRTFIDYARDFVTAQTDIKQKSRDAYNSHLSAIERVPSFAQLPLGAITHADVERLKRELSTLRTPRGGLLKASTKNGYLDTTFNVIRHAAAVLDIPRDVTQSVSKFRVDDAKAPCPISVEEFDSILVHVAPPRRALFRLLLDSGLRISEALALRWEDIRETTHGIYEVSVWELDPMLGKSGQAQRITTIPTETFKLLERTDETMVFPLLYSAAAKEWRDAVARARTPADATEFPTLMKRPTIHDLRHTHAGFLITKCGFNLALVAERLGHRDIGITQRYYGRLVKEQAHELGVLVARNIPRGTVS